MITPFFGGRERAERCFADAHLDNTDAGPKRREARPIGNVPARYPSNTVLLAGSLFFTGTSAKFDQRHVRQSSFFFALAAFLFAAVQMFMLPLRNLA
jgi:hypothetical protein